MKYYRLSLEGKIIGFRRKSKLGTESEYLAMAGHNWNLKKLNYDAEVWLGTPPVGIAHLKRS